MYRANHNHTKLIMDSIKKETTLDYLTGIDGLRAIAVLAVIIYHMDFFSFLPGGFTGVDVFFVISGYVISKSLSNKPSSNFFDYIFGFYRRRIIRIFPALIVCLIFTMPATIMEGSGIVNDFRQDE